MYHFQFEDELLGHKWIKLYAIEILDARCQWIDANNVANAKITSQFVKKCALLSIL